METRLGPLRLATPVIAAAGVLGMLTDAGRWPVEPALGAVVTASLALRSRGGRPPRIAETPAGALYVPGEARMGIQLALRRSARAWAAAPAPVVVSLADETPGALAAAGAELEGMPGTAAVELNLCEAEASNGVPLGHDWHMTGETVRLVRRACGLPVWIKLPADTPDWESVLAAGAAAGAIAATLTAGWPASGLDFGTGYLVGPATLPLGLALVQRIAPTAPLPIIACGGVGSAADAGAYLRAGAAAVQVGSAHFASPRAAWQVAAGLAEDRRTSATTTDGPPRSASPIQ
jgi:dihydroorotate dehydrogenase (NAD+) catalytic subunit